MRHNVSLSERGKSAYFAGAAAEEAVARDYLDKGLRLIARRWRGMGGEIDLIFGAGPVRVFVEVKKSKTHATATRRIGARQRKRIFSAAEEFLVGEPAGLLTESRFDVALVNALGEIDVLENALVSG